MRDRTFDSSDNPEFSHEIEGFEFDPGDFGDVRKVLEGGTMEDHEQTPMVGDKTASEVIYLQDREAEKVAAAFFKKVLRLRGVRIDREQFLRSELKQRRVEEADIERAIATDVITAGINPEILDDIARCAIVFETRKSSALSAAAGFGGVLTMAATVPADLTQYYVHAFRVMQKLAFAYGWTSFFDETDEVSDEVLAQFAIFLAAMLGVGGAANGIRAFMAQTAAPAIRKSVASKALTKTVWYPVMKKTLRMVGVKVTKDTVGKAAAKTVPVLGSVVAGSMTFVALKRQSERLQVTLRSIPSPTGNAGVSYFCVDLFEASEMGRRPKRGGAFRLAGVMKKSASEEDSSVSGTEGD